MNTFTHHKVVQVKNATNYGMIPTFYLAPKRQRLITHLQQEIEVSLTVREIECLSCNLFGFSAKQISCILNISHRTVEAYLQKALHKLSCFSKLSCLEKMYNLGILWDWHELARRLIEESRIEF